MNLARAIYSSIAWCWCRSALLLLDRLDDLEAYAWFESRAALHRRRVERLMEEAR
jgi:hypothetical protein